MQLTSRILVVDDDERIAASVRRALVYEGYEVETSADGRAALHTIASMTPDLVILDVMLPGIDGIETCRRIRSEGNVPVLMLTARDATEARVAGLDNGADDYLVKPFDYAELLARVRALLRRRGASSSSVLSFADITVDLATRTVSRGDRMIDPTPREYELLLYFLRNPRQVLTRGQILDAVWGYDFGGSNNSVDVYVGYLRRKLETAGLSRLIQTIYGVGYSLRDE
jgi:two-component system response regulator MprA